MSEIRRPADTPPFEEHPDIRYYRELCLTTEFPDEVAYMQGLLTIVHATDLAHQDENAQHTPETITQLSLALADIHYQTGHYGYCLGEVYHLITSYTTEDTEARHQADSLMDKVTVATMAHLPPIEFCPVSSQTIAN